MGRKYYEDRLIDTKRLMRRYYLARRGFSLEGDHIFTRYKSNSRVHTHLLEAPWTIVFYFVLANSICTTALKYTYFHFFGRPHNFMIAEELEQQVKTSLPKGHHALNKFRQVERSTIVPHAESHVRKYRDRLRGE